MLPPDRVDLVAKSSNFSLHLFEIAGRQYWLREAVLDFPEPNASMPGDTPKLWSVVFLLRFD
jgi:hypothetical protein